MRSLDGSNVETLIVPESNIPFGLALDVAGGQIYWTAGDPEGETGRVIYRASLDGSNVEALITGLGGTSHNCPRPLKH